MLLGPRHFVVVTGDRGHRSTETRFPQTLQGGDVGTVARHREHGHPHRVGPLELHPEMQIGGVTLDDPQALLVEATDPRPVIVHPDDPQPVMLRQALIGGIPHPAHADDDDLGVTGVTGAFLGVQGVFVLGRQPCGDLLDHQVPAAVDQRRNHETQRHRDGHLHQPGFGQQPDRYAHRHDDQPELRVVHQAQSGQDRGPVAQLHHGQQRDVPARLERQQQHHQHRDGDGGQVRQSGQPDRDEETDQQQFLDVEQ